MPLEKQADILFVDHARKNQAPGTHSYRFIELSIRNGQLEDLDAHAVGSATRVQRTVGSTVTAPKKGRNHFTDAEDQWLWNMIKPYMDAGGNWKGNEIYKQLERINSRHTYQSWRDRLIKYVIHQNRQITEQLDRHQMMDELEASQPARSTQQTGVIGQEIHREERQQAVDERPSSSAAQPRRSHQRGPVHEASNTTASPQPASRKRKILGEKDANDESAVAPVKRALPWSDSPQPTPSPNKKQIQPQTPEISSSSPESRTAFTDSSCSDPADSEDPWCSTRSRHLH